MRETKYFLLGMPASGKSTIGKAIARQFNVKFIDLDEVIVEKEGVAITEIFKTKGEDYFRELERKCLLNQIKLKDGFVLATGGGAPCFFDNMALMNKNGITIFLNVSVDDLFNKLSKKGTQKRPLLTNLSNDDLYLELENKLNDRKKYYEQSIICLDQNLNDINERVNQVIFAIKALKE
ncbi:MAG: shikimate kinase [Cyclobacteriaceae bacterium]|nr:shikimate kinase [Cyclobacteriaceae bacterium]MCK5468619.1 shikimate kinase [Cyclobacteriaceae bacterium]